MKECFNGLNPRSEINMDDFVRARIQNSIPDIAENHSLQLKDDENTSDADYFNQILNCHRKFGYTTIKMHSSKDFLMK